MTIRALFASGSGLRAHQLALDNTANNIANVNTTAFKRTTVDFQSLIYAGSDGSQIGSGTSVASISNRDFAQGGAITTGNDFDLLIQGDGFFRLLLPDGEVAYTRDGAFSIDAEGQLVNSSGLLVDPPITVPADTTSVSVGADGTVSVTTSGNINPTVIGMIQTARFINPSGLTAGAGNLYFESANSGAPMAGTPGTDGRGAIQQGVLESSNVELVSELVNLISAQRNFQFNARVFTTADQMYQTANGLVRSFG